MILAVWRSSGGKWKAELDQNSWGFTFVLYEHGRITSFHDLGLGSVEAWDKVYRLLLNYKRYQGINLIRQKEEVKTSS